jgi:hypothetical protein
VGGVRHSAQSLANAAESSVNVELARLLRHRAAPYEERRSVHSMDEPDVGFVRQTGLKMVPVSAQEHTIELEIQDAVAMRENAGALERVSIERASESFSFDDVGSRVSNSDEEDEEDDIDCSD